MDYAIGVFLAALIFWLTLGDGQFYGELRDKKEERVISAIAAGTIFNVANILLVIGIQVAGLSVAFPVGIGMALVGGTLFTYVIEPSGNIILLLIGVLLGFLAVVANGLSSKVMDEHKKSLEGDAEDPLLDEDGEKTTEMAFSKKIGICFLAGVLMSFWNPVS
jgi:glucose uptake protein